MLLRLRRFPKRTNLSNATFLLDHLFFSQSFSVANQPTVVATIKKVKIDPRLEQHTHKTSMSLLGLTLIKRTSFAFHRKSFAVSQNKIDQGPFKSLVSSDW